VPAGRLGAVADPVWRGWLHFGVSVRSLKRYRSKSTAKGRPNAAAIRQWRPRLRDAFRRYRVDCGTCQPTATELRKSVSGIVKAAQRFVASPTWELADELLTRLEFNRNVETVIRQGLKISRAEWVLFKREMRRQIAVSALPGEWPAAIAERSDRLAVMVVRIALLDVATLTPESGRWPDPALYRLVFVLAPLWEEVTGRTAAQSTDRIEQSKEFPFAEWLEDTHRLIGFGAPPRGRVLDVVLFQKSPASVRSEKI
jgi:hypothetical protein